MDRHSTKTQTHFVCEEVFLCTNSLCLFSLPLLWLRMYSMIPALAFSNFKHFAFV